MGASTRDFVAAHYGPRAQAYVASATHSTGDDLEQIESLLRGHSEAQVLDLGCGGGHVSYRASPHVASVVACDLTRDMLDAVGRTAASRGLSNIALRQAAAEALPFPDAAFDFVLCRFSAHHWQDVEAGLREVRRVLRATGRAVLIDTVAPGDPLLDTHLQAMELLRDASHVRNYTVAQWLAALSRSRLAVTALTCRRLTLDFPAWIARTCPPGTHSASIRSRHERAPASVRAYFAVAEQGSFTLDTVTLFAAPG